MKRWMLYGLRHCQVVVLVSLLGLTFLIVGWIATKAVVPSFADAAPTPDPRCGVAGVWNRSVLDALGLAQEGAGTPEPGGYEWDHLASNNAVQVVRPCTFQLRDDCYDVDTGAIRDQTPETPYVNENEQAFVDWVSSHPYLTWLVGNIGCCRLLSSWTGN